MWVTPLVLAAESRVAITASLSSAEVRLVDANAAVVAPTRSAMDTTELTAWCTSPAFSDTLTHSPTWQPPFAVLASSLSAITA